MNVDERIEGAINKCQSVLDQKELNNIILEERDNRLSPKDSNE